MGGDDVDLIRERKRRMWIPIFPLLFLFVIKEHSIHQTKSKNTPRWMTDARRFWSKTNTLSTVFSAFLVSHRGGGDGGGSLVFSTVFVPLPLARGA